MRRIIKTNTLSNNIKQEESEEYVKVKVERITENVSTSYEPKDICSTSVVKAMEDELVNSNYLFEHTICKEEVENFTQTSENTFCYNQDREYTSDTLQETQNQENFNMENELPVPYNNNFLVFGAHINTVDIKDEFEEMYKDHVLFEDMVIGQEVMEIPVTQQSNRNNKINKIFKCEHCKKDFNSKEVLKRHMSVHNNKKPHTCIKCGRGFSSFNYMKKHLNQVHGINRFECNYCGKVYKTKSALKEHAMNKHSNAYYNCKYCDKLYRDRAARNCHEKYFCEKNPHVTIIQCGICLKRFGKKSYLNKHNLQHEKKSVKENKVVTGNKFICDYCSKKFGAKSDMKKHIVVIHLRQKSFFCTYCNQQFGFNWQAKRHEKTCRLSEKVKNNKKIL